MPTKLVSMFLLHFDRARIARTDNFLSFLSLSLVHSDVLVAEIDGNISPMEVDSAPRLCQDSNSEHLAFLDDSLGLSQSTSSRSTASVSSPSSQSSLEEFDGEDDLRPCRRYFPASPEKAGELLPSREEGEVYDEAEDQDSERHYRHRTLPSKRIQIHNLPYSFEFHRLHAMFGAVGFVRAGNLLPHQDQSRSSAMIEYGTEEDAEKAVSCFHTQLVDGMTLDVTLQVGERLPDDEHASENSIRDGSVQAPGSQSESDDEEGKMEDSELRPMYDSDEDVWASFLRDLPRPSSPQGSSSQVVPGPTLERDLSPSSNSRRRKSGSGPRWAPFPRFPISEANATVRRGRSSSPRRRRSRRSLSPAYSPHPNHPSPSRYRYNPYSPAPQSLKKTRDRTWRRCDTPAPKGLGGIANLPADAHRARDVDEVDYQGQLKQRMPLPTASQRELDSWARAAVHGRFPADYVSVYGGLPPFKEPQWRVQLCLYFPPVAGERFCFGYDIPRIVEVELRLTVVICIVALVTLLTIFAKEGALGEVFENPSSVVRPFHTVGSFDLPMTSDSSDHPQSLHRRRLLMLLPL